MTTTSAERAAMVLLPPEPGSGRVVVGDEPPHAPGAEEVMVWAQRALVSRPARSALVRQAGRRKLAVWRARLRPPAGFHIRQVHRLPPPGIGAADPGLRSRVRSGVLVEFERTPLPRRFDELELPDIVTALRPERMRFGAGGTALVPARLRGGSLGILRVAGRGGEDSPVRRHARALGRFTSDAPDVVPRLLAEGSSQSLDWSLETLRPGRQARVLTQRLASEAVCACARLADSPGSPAQPSRDLEVLARALPERAPALRRMARALEGPLDGMPSVVRHGDLWRANLLVDRGRLSGVVDWDNTASGAAPLGDAVHLLATERRLKRKVSLGRVFLERPWRWESFRWLSGRWSAVSGWSPRPADLEVIGVCWWAGQLAGDLVRLPELAAEQRWVEENVDVVLESVSEGW